ncbi:hypothetical protein [Nostoc sp.]
MQIEKHSGEWGMKGMRKQGEQEREELIINAQCPMPNALFRTIRLES